MCRAHEPCFPSVCMSIKLCLSITICDQESGHMVCISRSTDLRLILLDLYYSLLYCIYMAAIVIWNVFRTEFVSSA